MEGVTVPSSESESEASTTKNIVDSVKNFLPVLYQFMYPQATFGRVSRTFPLLSYLIFKSYQKVELFQYWILLLLFNTYLDNNNTLVVLINFICILLVFGYNFCVSHCSRKAIRYVSIIFYWFVTGETPNMLFLFLKK